MINPTSGKRLLTPPFSLSFLYTIQESGATGKARKGGPLSVRPARAVRPSLPVYQFIFIEKQ